jgi:hypothetical protein
MNSEAFTIPDGLKGARTDREIIFSYTLKDGTTVRVAGQLLRFLVRDGACTRIEVRVNLARTQYPALTERLRAECPRNPLAKFYADRVQVEAPAAPAAWQPRRAAPTEKQVAYALDLAGRWEGQGDTLCPGMTRERFQAMSRHELSNWIDIARSEMGLDGI